MPLTVDLCNSKVYKELTVRLNLVIVNRPKIYKTIIVI